ncbi:anti-sigma factor [Flavobacteriaceae bacterium AU392]|nr:RNA polymerase subunit sigma-70 [Flavobacteriaceae bacterium]RKM82904.1 anti-sigma factor [Flavobacteriaceae bacterium AU392]
MKQKVQEFLESGILNKYIIGDISISETSNVENFINTYPEVKEEYDLLQDQLELAAKTYSKEAPTHILGSILDTLDDSPVIQLQQKTKKSPWIGIAASIAALVFAGTSYLFYNQNQKLLDENNTIAEEIFDLRGDIEKNNDKLDGVMREFLKLNNPETQKYVLRGNERAKELKTVAYINPIEKSTLIDIVALPELSDEQCYQMWAQLQDKMINLGVLSEADRKLKPIPYIKDALALNITIEPKGGNKNASLENSVAEIPINKDN